MDGRQDWREIHDGGSAEAEEAIFLDLAQRMVAIQEANRLKAGLARAYRTLHAKMVVGITDAVLQVDEGLPEALRAGHFQPGARLPVALRLSNASSLPQADALPDMRGAALRISLADGGIHDLLMTSFPVSHARNARQFVEFAVLASGDRATFVNRLVEAFGEAEARRMLGNVQSAARPSPGLSQERFWSRGAILWAGRPVRFDLRPAELAGTPSGMASDDLHADFANRLRGGDIRFRLALQPYVDETSTPIEDGAIDQPILFQAPNSLRQHPLGNIADDAPQIRKAQRPRLQLQKDQKTPTVSDPIKDVPDGALTVFPVDRLTHRHRWTLPVTGRLPCNARYPSCAPPYTPIGFTGYFKEP